MKKTLIAALVVIILGLAAYFSRSYWMPGVSPIQEIVINTGLVETGVVAEITGEVTNNIPNMNGPYQSGKYLYIPKAGLRFILPDGWILSNEKNHLSIKTNIQDRGYPVYIGISAYIDTSVECPVKDYRTEKCIPSNEINLDTLKKSLIIDDLKQYNKTYLVQEPADGRIWRQILLGDYSKKYLVIVDIGSDSYYIKCPQGGDTPGANWCDDSMPQEIDYPAIKSTINDMIGSAEEIL